MSQQDSASLRSAALTAPPSASLRAALVAAACVSGSQLVQSVSDTYIASIIGQKSSSLAAARGIVSSSLQFAQYGASFLPDILTARAAVAVGRGDRALAGAWLSAALWAGLGCSMLALAVFGPAAPLWLDAFSQGGGGDVPALARTLYAIRIAGMPVSLPYLALTGLLQGLQAPGILLVSSVVLAVVNAGTCWALLEPAGLLAPAPPLAVDLSFTAALAVAVLWLFFAPEATRLYEWPTRQYCGCCRSRLTVTASGSGAKESLLQAAEDDGDKDLLLPLPTAPTTRSSQHELSREELWAAASDSFALLCRTAAVESAALLLPVAAASLSKGDLLAVSSVAITLSRYAAEVPLGLGVAANMLGSLARGAGDAHAARRLALALPALGLATGVACAAALAGLGPDRATRLFLDPDGADFASALAAVRRLWWPLVATQPAAAILAVYDGAMCAESAFVAVRNISLAGFVLVFLPLLLAGWLAAPNLALIVSAGAAFSFWRATWFAYVLHVRLPAARAREQEAKAAAAAAAAVEDSAKVAASGVLIAELLPLPPADGASRGILAAAVAVFLGDVQPASAGLREGSALTLRDIAAK